MMVGMEGIVMGIQAEFEGRRVSQVQVNENIPKSDAFARLMHSVLRHQMAKYF